MNGHARGTSEVIGFVLVFALVFAGVGAVYTAGFDTLAEVRDREQVGSAERAFVVLSGTLDDVQLDGVGRSGTLSLGSGRLRVEAGPTVTAVSNGTGRQIDTGALTYRTSAGAMTLASGGVFRADGDASALRREPTMACRPGSDAAVVSVANLRSDRAGIDADGPVTVVARPESTSVWHADRVTLDVSRSAHRDAWARYLERTGWNATGPATYACDADRALVRRTSVRLRFVA